MLVHNVFIFGASALLIAGAAVAQSQEQSQTQSSSQTASQNSQVQQSQAQTQDQKTSASSTATPSTTQQTESLGDAARKARQENKNAHPAKTFTNDDLGAIRSGGISEVGQQDTGAEEGKTGTATKSADQSKDEAYWRKRFSELRGKITTKQQELDVLQRELNLLQREFYTDPNQMLQQQHSREDVNKKTDEIAAKQKELDDLNQQLSDMQDELRRAGGDPAWGR